MSLHQLKARVSRLGKLQFGHTKTIFIYFQVYRNRYSNFQASATSCCFAFLYFFGGKTVLAKNRKF